MSGANKTRKAAHKDGTAAAVMGRVGKDDELAERMRLKAKLRELHDTAARDARRRREQGSPDGAA